MKRLNRGLLAGVAAPALLTACSGGVEAPTPAPTASPAPGPAPVALQDQFGAIFSALFSGSVDVEATEPAANAVPPLDLTKEAVDG